MNLSCGNCKTIRSFSGEPPKCDVCGWVCGSVVSESEPSWRPKPRQRSIKEDLVEAFHKFVKIAIWAGLLIVGVNILAYWLTPENEKLANQYSVSKDKVIIEPKPHGCDFDDAPLGNKHCHFEKNVSVEKACPAPDCRVTAVYVSWRKVQE